MNPSLCALPCPALPCPRLHAGGGGRRVGPAGECGPLLRLSRHHPSSPCFISQVVADDAWDLQGYVGFSRPMQAIVVAFRGTDSHSIYNW